MFPCNPCLLETTIHWYIYKFSRNIRSKFLSEQMIWNSTLTSSRFNLLVQWMRTKNTGCYYNSVFTGTWFFLNDHLISAALLADVVYSRDSWGSIFEVTRSTVAHYYLKVWILFAFKIECGNLERKKYKEWFHKIYKNVSAINISSAECCWFENRIDRFCQCQSIKFVFSWMKQNVIRSHSVTLNTRHGNSHQKEWSYITNRQLFPANTKIQLLAYIEKLNHRKLWCAFSMAYLVTLHQLW